LYEIVVWHSHHLFHAPHRGVTWALGDIERLRVLIGKPVVAHFRARDIASGGTGAPLIPNADEQLFSDYETLINLGGIANITHLPTGIAYDISPCNQLLNALAKDLDPTLDYDPEGQFAKAGKWIASLSMIFEKHPHFTNAPPKSLDNITVKSDFIEPFLAYSASPQDKLHTATRLIAGKILEALLHVKARKYTLTGGGAYNSYLVSVLESLTHQEGIAFIPAPPQLVEYRESIGFGFLGLLRWLGHTNTYGKWTGAKQAHSSGSLSL
ncbi:MAG: anhydro-N-acetylmuramic acid kinase, partial [Bacteroidia bacterium]|nr:anhydro-N-acetylmuramic acid kinase [Bacteroidia bacterium]MDW8134546.1 anhydro-N-acetylmuramic acid kinase [Bacteroidia bacterium]